MYKVCIIRKNHTCVQSVEEGFAHLHRLKLIAKVYMKNFGIMCVKTVEKHLRLREAFTFINIGTMRGKLFHSMHLFPWLFY